MRYNVYTRFKEPTRVNKKAKLDFNSEYFKTLKEAKEFFKQRQFNNKVCYIEIYKMQGTVHCLLFSFSNKNNIDILLKELKEIEKVA